MPASLPARARRPRAAALGALLALWACTDATAPSTASDGLVFVRREGDGTDVMRVRISDGRMRALTRTPDRDESWPFWSQAAGRLVFQVAETGGGERGNADLVLWDPATGSETPIDRTPDRDERWAAWSPDGRRLVYAFRGGRPAAGIGIFELASGRSRVVAAAPAREYYLRPHFSPDGSRLVIQRRGADGTGSNLWSVERGAEPRPLTRDPAWFDAKAWYTRDGARVLYSRRPAAGGPFEIASVAADGSDPRVLVGDAGSDDHSARPSPTRPEFAFVSDRTGDYEIWLSDLPDGVPRRLTRTPDENEFAPVWSPDGERLAVIAIAAHEGQPRLAEPETLERVRVRVLDREGRTLLDVPGYNADWMPPW